MDIDLSKAPEGATHYTENEDAFQPFMRLCDGLWYWWNDPFGWKLYVNQDYKDIAMAAEIVGWSIYNNDKPLSELTDSQAAELFNPEKLPADRKSVV